MAVIGHEMLICRQSGFTEGIISFPGDERPYEITKINSQLNFTRHNFFEIVVLG